MVAHALVRRLKSHILPIKDNFPFSDGNKTCQRPEGSCLAGAIRSDDADDLAAIHLQAKVPNNLDRSIGQLEILHLK